MWVLIGWPRRRPLPGSAHCQARALDKSSGSRTGPAAFHPVLQSTRSATPHPVIHQRKTHSAAVLLKAAVNAHRLHGRMKLTTISRQSWKSKSHLVCGIKFSFWLSYSDLFLLMACPICMSVVSQCKSDMTGSLIYNHAPHHLGLHLIWWETDSIVIVHSSQFHFNLIYLIFVPVYQRKENSSYNPLQPLNKLFGPTFPL